MDEEYFYSMMGTCPNIYERKDVKCLKCGKIKGLRLGNRICQTCARKNKRVSHKVGDQTL